MATYEDKYVVDLAYTGQEAVQRFGGDVSKVREYLQGLSQLSGPTANALGSLDSKLRISDTTLQSYDRLLRYQAQLYSAQQRLKDVQASASVPLGTKGGFPNEYVRNATVATATAGVDTRAEALSKEVSRQIQASLAAQQRSQRETASAAAEQARVEQQAARESQASFNRILQTSGQFYKTLQERNAAAEKATAAEKAIAEQTQKQARLTSVDTALANRPTQTYPNADVSTHVGRAQSAVDQAQAGLKVSTLKLAEARDADSRTEASVIAAENRVAASAIQLASAQEKLQLLETRTSGSLGAQFRTGFKGTNADRSYAEQIGQAFKFSVFYGTAYKLLFGITQTLQATLQEGIAFQQAMTELGVAAGRPKDELNGLAQSLGSQAVQAGFAPSQGILVGARSLGLYGVAGGTGPNGAPTASQASEQDRVAEISARVVSRVAMGSGLQPADIQTNLAAISQALGTGAEGQVRSYDLDAYLTKKFGVAPGSTLAPVSESATVGKAAGFSQEQITSIAADLMARTGTTPETVAGYMAQIFSRSGEGALTGVEQKYGVNSNTPLSQQFSALSKVYAKNPDARDEISATFGRGKVQNAVIALLQDYPHVQAASKEAVGGATGAGDKQYKLRLDNLGGQLNITAGIFKDFADQLGQSGMLADLGAMLVIVREVVQAGTELLREWNVLPGVIKDTAIALASLALAAKVGGLGFLGGAGASGLVRGAYVSGRETSLLGSAGLRNNVGGTLIRSNGQFASVAERDAALAAGGLGATRAGVGAAARAGVASVGGLGVAAAVLGDVYLWGNLGSATRKLTDAQNQATQNLRANLGPDATAEQLQAHAANLSTLADQSRSATHGLFASITGGKYGLGPNNSDVNAQAGQLDQEAARLNALAQYQKHLASVAPASQALVTGYDSTSLSTSMDAITSAGGNASDRLNALNATLLGTANAAGRVQAAFDPKLFAGENAAKIYGSILSSTSLQQTQHNVVLGLLHNSLGTPAGQGTTTNIAPGLVSSALTQSDVAGRLQNALAGTSDLGSLGKRQIQGIASSVVGNAADPLGQFVDPAEVEKARKQMVAAVAKYLKKQADDVKTIIHGTGRISQTDLTAIVTTQVGNVQDLVNSLPQNDFAGRITAEQDLVRNIEAYVKRTSGGITPAVQDQLDAAQRAVAEAQIARLEALRTAAQHMASGPAEIKNIGQGYFKQEVAAAIRGGDSDALVQLVDNAGNWGIGIAKAAINQALKAARAAVAVQDQVAAFAASEIAGIKGMIGRPGGPSGATSAQQHRIDQLNGLLKGLDFATPSGKGNAYDTGSDANLGSAQTETALQKQAAAASANAVRSESQISQARAAMLSARADMATAAKGSTEYYSALSSYYDARNQLTDAILAYRNNQYLLGHDITNPLVQARATLVAARAKLRSDAGKPGDVTSADKVAERQAQASVEAQAFQQRLDAVQTAESLGRVSYSAYINYLDHERDRLRNIGHRSYQQQQELNQVDQLLKTAADQMQGQWNFGDIKLPTPYQVRRYIEQHSGSDVGGSHGVGGGGASVTNHNTRIVIDGADTGQILRILRQYLGSPGRTRTTGTRHR